MLYILRWKEKVWITHRQLITMGRYMWFWANYGRNLSRWKIWMHGSHLSACWAQTHPSRDPQAKRCKIYVLRQVIILHMKRQAWSIYVSPGFRQSCSSQPGGRGTDLTLLWTYHLYSSADFRLWHKSQDHILDSICRVPIPGTLVICRRCKLPPTGGIGWRVYDWQPFKLLCWPSPWSVSLDPDWNILILVQVKVTTSFWYFGQFQPTDLCSEKNVMQSFQKKMKPNFARGERKRSKL